MKAKAETKNESLESITTGNIMKLTDILFQHPSEERLLEIASKIRPLPEAITPSANFLRQMRQRLLQLQAGETDQKAA